jgi:hypothetical protein
MRALPNAVLDSWREEIVRGLAENRAFWNHTTGGLAVLSASGLFRVYRLQRPVVELAVIGDSFHTKPLMRIGQSADRYQILARSRKALKVYEGNRDALDEMLPIEGEPQTAGELTGKDANGREGAHRAYGPTGDAAWHGTDVKQSAADRDTERFFRAVGQAYCSIVRNPLECA